MSDDAIREKQFQDQTKKTQDATKVDEVTRLSDLCENAGDRILPRVVHGPWRGRRYSKTMHIAGGGYHSCLVTEAGELFTAGVGANGRLGLGHERPSYTPHLVTWLTQHDIYLPPFISTESANMNTEQYELRIKPTMALMYKYQEELESFDVSSI
mmetsp:Transcript_7839/g.10599  ORF Transcript_7839/g.10599 Transcript_7839/m.10599 type:complete len:155 (-) Transcript_7839:139-603(-)